MNHLAAYIASGAVVLGFVTAVLGFIAQRRAGHAARVAQETAVQVSSISVQVDGRLSTLLERQSQLLDALHQGGIAVPPKPGEGEGSSPKENGVLGDVGAS